MRAATSSESSLSFWRWSFLVEGEGAPPLPLLLALVLPPGEGGVLVEEKEEVCCCLWFYLLRIVRVLFVIFFV